MLAGYLLREVWGFYLAGILLFMALRTTDLLSARSGIFLQRQTPITDILLLAVYRLPDALGISLAFGLVFAVLVTLARWIRQSELKAALASGIHPRRLLWPIVALGLVFAVVALYVWGWVRPMAQERFNDLEYKIFFNEAPSGALNDALYTPEGLGVYYAQRIFPNQEGGSLLGVRVVKPDGTVLSAVAGQWSGQTWRLEQVQQVAPDGVVQLVPQLELPFQSFSLRRGSLDELTLPELQKLAQADATARFSLQQLYANAAAVLILAWLAGVIGLSLRDAAWAFVSVVFLLFFYYVLWSLSNQFARFDVLGAYGAWVANGVYALLALVGTLRLR